MTLKELVRYLHEHTGYNFIIRANNEYSVYGIVGGFKGYITEKDGKFYMFSLTTVGNGILNHSSIRHQRILCYMSVEYKYHAIYEISLQQDKKPYSE